MAYDADLEGAHRHSSCHRDRDEVLSSQSCACFYCLEAFSPADIRDWIDVHDGVGTTALCPRCGIESVLGSNAGVPLDQAFLQRMHQYWFER
jgi:hypothetical protein